MFYIYSKPNCPGCLQTKRLLHSEHKPYTEIMLDVKQPKMTGMFYFKLEELEAKVPGVKSVPQIFLDDTYIGGLVELHTYLENLNSTLSR